MKRFSIKNKNIVIFGGSGQIGQNVIDYFLDLDANIFNCDISDIRKKKITSKKNYSFYKIDLNEKQQVDVIFNNQLKKNRIDCLINLFHFKGNRNLAPKNSFFEPFHKYNYADWSDTININLNSLFLICKNTLNIMMRQRKGNIINVSSTYGIVSPNKKIYGKSGINNPIGYSTTKGAIINFTKYIATHYSDYNIRANVISPGGVKNKMQSNEFVKNYSQNTPLKRLAKPWEYNEAFLFLASDASSYMTGSNLIVDGGWTAW